MATFHQSTFAFRKGNIMNKKKNKNAIQIKPNGKAGKNIGQIAMEQISGLFFPIINIITATSILKSILVLLANFNVLSTDSGVYQIFYACSDGFFYFLPFFLAYTASKQWKTDPFISMLIPITMLYPNITAVLENNGSYSFFGLTILPTIYHASVLPVIFSIGLLFFVEKPCEKWLPSSIKGFVKPILCCLIVLPFTFLVFGPLGSLIGNLFTKIFFAIYSFSPVFAGAFMGFSMQPLVAVGAHWSIVPISINNVATIGYDVIMPLVGAAVYAQAGAALSVGMMYEKKPENEEKRRAAFQAALAAALGVTEPALFGVNLTLVRPMINACIAGSVGGAMVGYAGTHCNAFAFPSFLTSVAYVGPGFITFLLSMVVGFVLSMALMFLQRRKMMEKLN